MATADEILATMAEEAAATDQMAEVCTIDRCTRAVTIPEALRIVGVETDKDVTRRVFRVLCSYRGTNLSTFRIRIHFMNANKEKDIYYVTDAAQDGEYLTFSWVISRKATKYKGKLQFIACMVCDGGSDEEREWNSTLGEFTVLEGLEVELTDGEEEQARDAITQLLAVIDAKGAATLETIPDDYTTLHNNVAALTEDIAEETNRAKAEEARIEKLFVGDVSESVGRWLDEHPEATTTVQDKSLTIDKMVVGTLGYVTPEMFGAVGDGVTDDTAAIRAMFDAVSANDEMATVQFNGGSTYLISPPTDSPTAIIFGITKGLHIVGNGAKLKIAPNTDGYTAIIGHGSADLTGLHIEGLEFDHNAQNTNDFTVGNRYGAGVLDSNRGTVLIKNSLGFVFRNNIVRNCACTNCITYSGDGNTSNCLIEGNQFLSMGLTPNRVYHDHSTLYPTGDNIKVLNNHFEGAEWGVEGTTCAIEAHPGDGCVISGNTITKYQSAINYAAVYETDSKNGVISDNVLETLRHSILLFGTAYKTHTEGYSIDGLVILGNQIKIRNAIPKGYMSGGVQGVGGIVFNASLSLPVRNVLVESNQLSYDIEAEKSDYTPLYAALGIQETSSNTVYDNVIFRRNTLLNPPIACVRMGNGNGTLKNCAAYDIRIVNPFCTKNKDITYYYRYAFNANARAYEGSFRMGGDILDASKDLLVRPFAIDAAVDSTEVPFVLESRIEWIDPPADWTTYKLLTKYSDKITPMLRVAINAGSIQTIGDFAPDYGSAKVKAGSYIYKRDTNAMRVYVETGTVAQSLTPTTAAEAALIGLIS